MKETEAKYLAGLSDADASLSFHFQGNRLYLEYQLAAAETVDKQGYVRKLPDMLGYGYVTSRVASGNMLYFYRVTNKTDLEKFLPHLIKHMVIKGEHWAWLLEVRRKVAGQLLSTEQIVALREASKESRKRAGGLKPRVHPTWAWVAGYLDGDGCYKFRNATNKRGVDWKDMSISCTSHENDRVGLDLLQKAFGGKVYLLKNKPHCIWHRNLGKRDSSFALKFLSKVVNHSRLKKWKIEQMISFHRMQRLNPTSPKGRVIV